MFRSKHVFLITHARSNKMAEELQKVHLYYDEINKVRILETNVTKETEDLKNTCKDYDISKYL